MQLEIKETLSTLLLGATQESEYSGQDKLIKQTPDTG